MNKLTKLLSVFVIAGAIGTGVAGAAGCAHKHKYSDEWTSAGESGHYHMATCKHTDEHDDLVDHTYDNDSDTTCNDCGYVRTLTPSTPSGPTTPTTPTTPGEETPTPEVVKATEVEITSSGATKVGVTKSLAANVTPANSTETAKWEITEGATLATIDENTGALTAGSEVGEVTVKLTVGEVSSTKKVRIVKDEAGLTYITSAEELENVRTTASLSGTYKLACDIDMDGVALGTSKAVLAAGVTFDGDGYTISNANYAAANKTGLLFATATGGTVTNVKFLGCVADGGSNETEGIIIGTATGDITFSKIEFNSCMVNCSSYCGLLIGRYNQTNGTLTISEITTKNGTVTQSTSYGGFLFGYIEAKCTMNFTNLDLNGEFKGSSQNGSFVSGRIKNDNEVTLSVTNSVINAKIPSASTMGIIAAPKKLVSATISNVLITGANSQTLIYGTQNAGAVTIENLVTVSDVTVNGATATNGENTVAYLTDTLGFDFTDVWMAEGDGYRLKAASTNIKGADATIKKLKVNTSNVKTRFKVGDTFSTEGLVVMGAYSDGVQLVLNGETGYDVDKSAVKDEAGTYTVTITSKEDSTIKATYQVVVAAQTGFKVYDEFMAHTYLVGETLDKTNLVVKSTWSDGLEEDLKEETAGYSILASSYDMGAVGTYEVKVKHGSYEDKIIKISVQATKPVPVDGKVYVNVDSAYAGANGAQVHGIETFNTVKDAIDYLEACGLDSSVQKVVNIGEGTYEAKITTDLANLVLVGAGDDKSVLTYSAVEGMIDPVSGKQWGMNCATLHVKGEGFKAYNLTIRNDFNYIRDNKKYASPQGFALTVNGDKAVIENCHLYGNQDTLYIKDARAYFKNTLIEGNVDFIFGEGKNLAYFDHCTINSISRNSSNNGYVTAAKHSATDKPDYGYIFDTCNFTHGEGVGEGSMSLGRTWGAKATVAMINCNFSEAYSTHGYKTDLKDPAKPNEYIKGRWEDMGGDPEEADFVESGSTGAGAITEKVNGGKVIDATAAANYTAANLFAATNGNVTWTAAWDYTEDLTLLGTLATGVTTPATATGIYVSTNSISVEAGSKADLLISVNPWNASDKSLAGLTVTPGDPAIATYANGKVTGVAAGQTTLTISATGMDSVQVTVNVTAPDTSIKAHNFAFNYSQIDTSTVADVEKNGSTTKDTGAISAGTLSGADNAFLTVGSGVTYRTSNNCIENKGDGLTVTFQGTGTISITFSSTGAGNQSRCGLKDSSGQFLVVSDTNANGGTLTVIDSGDYKNAYVCGNGLSSGNGTTQVTINYTITTPGTYTISCPYDSTINRGARIMGIVMVDNYSDAQ